jgi:hypothetical protein
MAVQTYEHARGRTFERLHSEPGQIFLNTYRHTPAYTLLYTLVDEPTVNEEYNLVELSGGDFNIWKIVGTYEGHYQGIVEKLRRKDRETH